MANARNVFTGIVADVSADNNAQLAFEAIVADVSADNNAQLVFEAIVADVIEPNRVSKALAYAVLKPPGVPVSKALAYAVLTKSFERVATSSLVLTHEATYILISGEIYEESVDGTLLLTQEATYVGAHWFLEELEDTLTLTQDATYVKINIYEESADNTLVITDEATYTKIHIYEEDVEDILVITDEADSNFFKRPGSLIQLVQTVVHEAIFERTATSTIVFISTSATKGILQSVASVLSLTQTATFIKSVPLEADNSVTLSDEATYTQSKPRFITSYLVLTQEVSGSVYFLEGVANNDLTLSQDVSILQIRNLVPDNDLTLTETATRQFIADREPNNTLTLSDYAFCLILKDKKYAILHAPYNTCLESIILPNPIFGDTEGTTADVIIKRSMSGATRTYVKRNTNRRLKYTFILTRTKGIELMNFIQTYGSEQIMLQNWKGEIWKVNIITNPLELVQGGRWYPNGARTEINLEFEGERVA